MSCFMSKPWREAITIDLLSVLDQLVRSDLYQSWRQTIFYSFRSILYDIWRLYAIHMLFYHYCLRKRISV
jgi:hypothetical protein